MKITLVTTFPSAIENKRLREEAEKMGHKFKTSNLDNLVFKITNSCLKVEGLTDLKTDLIIVRGIFSSIKTISAVVEGFRRRGVKVFDNNLLDHKYSISKVTDIVKLSLASLPVPDTVHARRFGDYPVMAKNLGYPVIVKSTRTGKGIRVFKFDTEKDLMEFIDGCQEEGWAAKNFLIQEFIPYVYDLRILVIGKKIFTMRRIPAEGEFRANFSLGGRVETFDLDGKSQKLALRALQAVGLSLGGVDLLITKEKKPYLLEVNHTAGFLGMEKATGENIAKVWLEHAISNAR
ncbi:RimK family alpha-L-glutamate ligase [Patescibacteria group bacterium]